eukprot:c9400_g1_i3.p1 GENE.c9400_g1_i3~~c9400_g1_i3.p1  ORF type:complete len:349 (-),score=82.34 c9400_g1_i3:235-1281(-)
MFLRPPAYLLKPFLFWETVNESFDFVLQKHPSKTLYRVVLRSSWPYQIVAESASFDEIRNIEWSYLQKLQNSCPHNLQSSGKARVQWFLQEIANVPLTQEEAEAPVTQRHSDSFDYTTLSNEEMAFIEQRINEEYEEINGEESDENDPFDDHLPHGPPLFSDVFLTPTLSEDEVDEDDETPNLSTSSASLSRSQNDIPTVSVTTVPEPSKNSTQEQPLLKKEAKKPLWERFRMRRPSQISNSTISNVLAREPSSAQSVDSVVVDSQYEQLDPEMKDPFLVVLKRGKPIEIRRWLLATDKRKLRSSFTFIVVTSFALRYSSFDTFLILILLLNVWVIHFVEDCECVCVI